MFASKWVCIGAAVALSFVTVVAQADTTINFSDLSLSPNSFYAGQTGSTSWSSGGASFNNSYTDYGGGSYSWEGWAYSNVVNSTTPGYGNQYASFPGGGADANGNVTPGSTYAVAYGSPNDPYFSQPAPVIDLPNGTKPVSVYLANTTYAALAMQQGTGFSKQFFTGQNPDDFFTVTLTGYSGLDASGSTTGSVTVSLSGFQPSDFILGSWQSVNLAPLGNAESISFSFASSDVGTFGINTPTYVALDDLVVASPATQTPGAVPLPMAVLAFPLAALFAGRLSRRARQI